MHFSRQSLEASTTNEDLESVWKCGLKAFGNAV